jgi:glycosyltransferase involved in cell wall biosynthesis
MSSLVSIVTPSYNSGPFIAQTIESVLAQTYPHWEMLIVDDGSVDQSISIVEQYHHRDSRVRLIQMAQNGGVARARNRAIEEARGQYIAFLDSDDLWQPQKLEKQVRFMEETGAALSCTAYLRMNEAGTIRKEIVTVPNRVSYRSLLKSNTIGCLTALYDAKKVGPVAFQKVGHEDYLFWLEILKRGNEAYGLTEPLSIYRMRSGSVSRNKFKVARYQWRIYRELEHLSLAESLLYFIQYVYYGLTK